MNYSKAYSSATTNASVIKGSGNDLVPASIGLSKGDTTSYEYAMVAVMGIVTSATANYNNTTDGTIIPQGAPVTRNFVSREAELYAQDSWRVKRNLTRDLRTAPVDHASGARGQRPAALQQHPDRAWMDTRGALAEQGLSDQGAGLPLLRAQRPPLLPAAHQLAAAPGHRLQSEAVPAGFPGSSSASGKTSIRAGAGMYYDLIGQPLAGFIASNSYGLSTSLSTPPNVYTSAQLPRYAGFNQIPSSPNAPLFFQPAPKPTFPVSYPDAFAITSSLDDRLNAPYTMNLNFSVARELPPRMVRAGRRMWAVSRATTWCSATWPCRPTCATRSPARPTSRR